MESSIIGQVYIFLITLLGGMAIGLTYDLYRLFRYYARPKRVKTLLQDLMFWMLLSIGIIIFVNRVNEGELRGFIFIGFTIGILLYSRLLSRTVIKCISYTVNIIVLKIKSILNILLNPFRTIVGKCKQEVKNVKKYLKIPKVCYNNAVKGVKTVLKKR